MNMSSIEVPDVCALAINNLPIVGMPIWRITEGKHIVKLEITWQLPRSTTTRRSNQRSKRKMLADGVTGDKDGVTKMADQSKMAAPTLPTTTDTLNVARCASPSASSESREKTPPRLSIPSTAAVTTTDQPLEGEWKKVLSRKKSTPKKPSRASTPKEQPMPQRRRTPSPPKKVQVYGPSKKEGKTTTGVGRAFPLHEKYDLDEVVSGTIKDKRKYYIVKANRLPRLEEEINVDLPAYFMHIHKEKDPRPRWLFVKGPTSKAFHKKLYEKMGKFYQQARPSGDAVYWYDLLDRSSKGTDLLSTRWHQILSELRPPGPF